jgi:DNA polymerase III alpha subunit
MNTAAAELHWTDLVSQAEQELSLRGLADIYIERLRFEIAEVEKQGAEMVWVNRVRDGKRYVTNPNNLVLPWLLGMVDDDPIASRQSAMLNTVRASKVSEFKEKNGIVPHDLIKDPDSPDIDLDCLPDARDPIKQYAIEKYGQSFNDEYGSVCSVGTWQTFKFKSAIIDAAVALGLAPRGHGGDGQTGRPGAVYTLQKADKYTSELPEDVDDLKEGGRATCKARIIIEKNGKREEQECGTVHADVKCPKCGSDSTDAPTLGQVIQNYPVLASLVSVKHPVTGEQIPLLEIAANLIGRIRNMGMHAGAIIITNRPLYGNIPLARSSSKGYWTSMWTEGRNTQLSKFGYIKWDILGLKTLEYIFRCCKLIEQNRGISFGKNMDGMEYNNPVLRHAGYYIDAAGTKHFINMDDPHALRLANEQKTDGVFQFDTDLAKSILANQSRCFEDLMLFNAMGHPGPMASIPEAVKNRDDTRGGWKRRLHPEFLEVLEQTYGVICYQEQLQALWQNIAGFTSPEAQDARKSVAKKWVDKLKPVEKKWIEGAGRKIGHDNAVEWWTKMVTFGRYAFNRSHAVSYCLVALKCLWLKAHFAPEFWAAVMSDCHPDKLVRYMGVARAEGWEPTEITYCGRYKGDGTKVKGVRFGPVNIEHLTVNFTVTGDTVNQGLIGIKGIGESAAEIFHGSGTYATIDEFVESAPGRQSKTVLERFVKLGAFRGMHGHENARALWMWYQYKYCKSGKDMTTLRNDIRQRLLAQDGWNDKTIKEEIGRQISEYRRQFPKRNKIPAKFANWRPKPNDTRERVMALFPDDFTMQERLDFQKQFLGYWIDSPLDLYESTGNCTINACKEAAKRGDQVRLEGIILDIDEGRTKKDQPYLKVFITDGIQRGLVFIWSNELNYQDFDVLKEGVGVTMMADYDDKRSTFSLARGETVHKLKAKGSKKKVVVE